MSKQWYYAVHGKQFGPVTSQKLKELANSGTISATDLIWTEGQSTWQPAHKIENLFHQKNVIQNDNNDNIDWDKGGLLFAKALGSIVLLVIIGIYMIKLLAEFFVLLNIYFSG